MKKILSIIFLMQGVYCAEEENSLLLEKLVKKQAKELEECKTYVKELEERSAATFEESRFIPLSQNIVQSVGDPHADNQERASFLQTKMNRDQKKHNDIHINDLNRQQQEIKEKLAERNKKILRQKDILENQEPLETEETENNLSEIPQCHEEKNDSEEIRLSPENNIGFWKYLPIFS